MFPISNICFQRDLVSGGQDDKFIISNSHGNIELGVTFADNQPVGQISAQTSLAQVAHINTNVSLNTDGQISAYVGVKATW